MDTKSLNEMNRLTLIANRIKEMRDILGYSPEQMAEKTEVTAEEYLQYETGKVDLPFTFLHKCSIALGIQLTELLEGSAAHLSSYTVTRKGKGENTAEEDGISIQNMAPNFKDMNIRKSFRISPSTSQSTTARNSTMSYRAQCSSRLAKIRRCFTRETVSFTIPQRLTA